MIGRTLLQQGLMWTPADDLSLLEYQDGIGIFYGTQSMCHSKGDHFWFEFMQGFYIWADIFHNGRFGELDFNAIGFDAGTMNNFLNGIFW